MTSKEALDELLYFATLDDSGFEPHMKDYANQIKKDLDILEDFIKLFEGQDLESWIEFNFGYTREPEDSIDNYNGFVSLLKRIRNYLEEIRK